MKWGLLSRAQRRDEDINIAPLIDMVFILLIFFMVTTTFARDLKLEIERPEAQTAAAAHNEALRVAVSYGGDVSIDGNPVSPWMLQTRVREALTYRSVKQILVVADTHVETGELVHVVDQCKLAGAANVAVAVNEGHR